MSANIYLSSFTSNSKTPGSAFVADSHHASIETNILRLEEIHTHQDNYGRNAKIDEANDTDDDSTTNNEVEFMILYYYLTADIYDKFCIVSE